MKAKQEEWDEIGRRVDLAERRAGAFESWGFEVTWIPEGEEVRLRLRSKGRTEVSG